MLISPQRQEAVVNTFWDTQEEAEEYNSTVYTEVLKTLAHVIEGTPIVATFEFANAPFHKPAAAGLA